MNKEENKIKNLLFKVTMKQYSDFWFVGSLLGKSKKEEIFQEMINFVKKFKEKNT